MVFILVFFVFGMKMIWIIFLGIFGKDCFYDDVIKDIMLFIVYYVFLVVIFFLMFVILGILYIKIVIVIYEWKYFIIGEVFVLFSNKWCKIF